MFDIDHWQEILDTIRKNKLRTFLTALSVAWGIFMLVILLGAGNGLQNGVEARFQDDAVNSMWVWSGQTSVPHAGQAPGRSIQFRNGDYDMIRATIEQVEHITARFHISGEVTVSYGDKHASFDVRSCHPAHQYLEKTIMVRGRFLNELDLAERRKVAVIGTAVVSTLFDRGEEPLGSWIDVNGIQYRVIGIFEDAGGEGELRKIYIPITTAQMAYGGADKLDTLMFTVGDASAEEAADIERRLGLAFAERHHFSPGDRRAVRIRNNVERYQMFQGIFTAIDRFVFIVGFGTIIAGIVGVSNIMMISVKERTREIGVRKALGATPRSIVGLIMQESVLITTVSGYAGLVLGVGLLELVGKHMPPNEMFHRPEVDIGIAVLATVMLVVFGALAGSFPAWRAARVNPVEALRDE